MKNRTMRVAALLLVLTLMTSCFVGGTFAKYTSSVTATDTVRVAKFDVSAFEEGTASGTATVDIFKTVWDNKDVTDYTIDGTDDSDVDNAADGQAPIIAPGTWGKFTFDLTNNSEVTVNYSIDYEVNEAGVPLEWSIDGTNWTDTLEDVAATAIDEEASVTIYWRWQFDGNDTTDTALGVAGSATPSVTITVRFEQVD